MGIFCQNDRSFEVGCIVYGPLEDQHHWHQHQQDQQQHLSFSAHFDAVVDFDDDFVVVGVVGAAVAAVAVAVVVASAGVADVVVADIDVIVRYMLSNAALADSSYLRCRDGI